MRHFQNQATSLGCQGAKGPMVYGLRFSPFLFTILPVCMRERRYIHTSSKCFKGFRSFYLGSARYQRGQRGPIPGQFCRQGRKSVTSKFQYDAGAYYGGGVIKAVHSRKYSCLGSMFYFAGLPSIAKDSRKGSTSFRFHKRHVHGKEDLSKI